MDILVVEDGPVKIFKDPDAFAAFVKRLTFRKQSVRRTTRSPRRTSAR